MVSGTPAPPAPEPSAARHPEPRPLWRDPEGAWLLCALDYTDPGHKHFVLLRKKQGQWETASLQECGAWVAAIGAWFDERTAEP